MTHFQIIEAKDFHCGQMARALRDEHRKLVAGLGFGIHSELRSMFDASAFRRCWLIDGRLAALGGVTGTMLATDGLVWLAVSDLATRYPVAMVREARRQLDEIMTLHHRVYSTVIKADRASVRFAHALGFAVPPIIQDNVAQVVVHYPDMREAA